MTKNSLRNFKSPHIIANQVILHEAHSNFPSPPLPTPTSHAYSSHTNIHSQKLFNNLN